MRRSHEARLAPLREDVLERLGEVGARGVANIAHGAAKAGLRSRPPWDALWEGLGSAARGRMGEFDPQALSNTSWAFAKAGHAAPALFEAVAAATAPRVGEFNPQDLANTAWAFATAGHAAPALLDAVAAAAAARAGEFNPQNLANTAWAFATAGHAAPALFDAVAAEAAGRTGGRTSAARGLCERSCRAD